MVGKMAGCLSTLLGFPPGKVGVGPRIEKLLKMVAFYFVVMLVALACCGDLSSWWRSTQDVVLTAGGGSSRSVSSFDNTIELPSVVHAPSVEYVHV